ncbi:MAG: methyltransferase domain-containing protein [Polyangiales bacterium]
MTTRAAIFAVFAGWMALGCDGVWIVGAPGTPPSRVEVSATPSLYRSPTGSDAQPWELHDMNGATSMVEPVPPADPVLAFPTNVLWREFWFPIDNPERDRHEAPRIVQRMIHARPGMQIADLGAGGGYFSFRFARAVGERGHVWAVDIDGRATSKIAWEAHARGLRNLTAVRVLRGELGLDDLRLDAAVMLETGALNSCEPANKVHYLEQIAMAIRPGGDFVFQEVTADTNVAGRPDSARGCRTPHAEEVVELARPYFDLVRREDVSAGDWRSFILHLRRR